MTLDEAIETLGGLVSAAGGEGDDALDVVKDAVSRSTIIDMLCAAQGEAFREFYEGRDQHGVAAVDRALAVIRADRAHAS